MAQTIAEKLAEKYDVTPSTTIAGTLKKITNDETGDVNIASLISKMEAGGGGASRILLFENNALDISTDGASGIHYNGNNQNYSLTQPFYYDESGVYTLEIDGEVAVSGAISYGAFKLGLSSPSDTDGVEDGKKAGVGFAANMPSPLPATIYGIQTIMINDTFFTTGTHSVKIYKEV